MRTQLDKTELLMNLKGNAINGILAWNTEYKKDSKILSRHCHFQN